jgi:hypothetical protein
MRAGDPQSFNRYSYVQNEPTNFVDPSGLNMVSYYCYDIVTDGHYTNDPSHNYVHTETVCGTFGGGGNPWDDRDPGGGTFDGGGGGVGAEHDDACDTSKLNIPSGVNIGSNVSEAKKHAVGQSGLLMRPVKEYSDAKWFKSMVQDGGTWDFKKGGHLEYENFGNFHFGVVGLAAGFPMNTLLRMAGLAQQQGKAKGDGGKSGTQSEIMADYAAGIEGGEAPYGDQWIDQYWINKGFLYYLSNCYK